MTCVSKKLMMKEARKAMKKKAEAKPTASKPEKSGK
jgi:hypothetical protein